MTANRREQQGPSTVVWVDAQRAIVASTEPDGGIVTERLERGAESETEFLAHVVHEISDQPAIGIVGPSDARIALEREYVAISHRPERLVGIPTAVRAAGSQVLARMRRLAA
jgi:hypothetical protein